jgi:predicted RNase H-like HicB family nuclease
MALTGNSCAWPATATHDWPYDEMEGKRMRVDYTVQIWREGALFIAQAMPIDVVSAGSTPEQARTALDEAVGLFLSTAQQMGTLPEILEECSYEHDESGWRAPEWIAVERHSTQLSA